MEKKNKFDWTNLRKEISMNRKFLASNTHPIMINNVIGLRCSGFMFFKTINFVKNNDKAIQKGQIKPTDTGWDRINYKLLQSVINAKKQLLT